MLIIDCYSKDIKWWQKLFLKLESKLFYSYLFLSSRKFSKTGLVFMQYLVYLKSQAKTKEEKEYIDQIQKEWTKHCSELNLKYWNN